MKHGDQERVALSPKEFATLFGKSQTWGYRRIYDGKVKTITEYGRIMIPAAEVERILGEAERYNGLKPKIPKTAGRLDGWRKYVVQRRKTKGLPPSPTTNGRTAAVGRLKERLKKS